MSVQPNEVLEGENWLTDAHDAEVGMTLVFEDGGDTKRLPVEEIEHTDTDTVLFFYPNADDGLSITASEVNDRDDVVVV